MLYTTKRCGRGGLSLDRGGEVVRRPRPVDDTARLRGGAVRPSAPPPRPIQQNVGALHEAVAVSEEDLWGRRVKRTAVAFAGVLLFVALVVLSGRPFGNGDQPSPQPSVPSASADGSSAATEQERKSGAPGSHPEGSSGGALPPAQGVQAFSGGTEPRGTADAARAERGYSVVVAAAPPQRRAGGPVAGVVHGRQYDPVVDAARVAQSGRVGSNWFSASSSWRTYGRSRCCYRLATNRMCSATRSTRWLGSTTPSTR